ncbi:hypothetical protein QIH47_24780 [Klebsiella pneumoniae]|nr:hypothetical protein [Klebsiella pneumoniae]AZP00881.1 hypothetical protein C2D60_22220 [Klebsiella pneumoniae]MDH8596632.1 hypothetical protein [Klebsiella pneumoniae]SBX71961.1 ATP phosphoribosyltransferase [Klebsiella pneumoniae]SBY32398.1 ATP phosphoribosyltransferase [Klebsiella pneumoniae]STV50330.1 ATP phosphoribosyltransferase [Klebsiella pneumoniae]
MVNKNVGMTKFYNEFHNPAINSPSLSKLRELQVSINHAVLRAYGFDDIDLNHDFHEVAYLPEGKNIRYTICESAREKLLYRLASLNKIRYEEGQKGGINDL